MSVCRLIAILIAAALLGALPPAAMCQGPAGADGGTSTAPSQQPGEEQAQKSVTYTRPTEKTKIQNYLFDAFGPYPIAGAAIVGGIQQWHNVPPEWMQGAGAYGQRVGSAFGVALVTTTTRYALAEILRENTLYYRCECNGVFPRLRHAMISTLTARRGEDGHRVFSIAALGAPYAGTMTAALGWYPGRYGPKDGFRTGNYSLLAYAGGNIAIEFLYGGPHSVLERMHLTSKRAARRADP